MQQTGALTYGMLDDAAGRIAATLRRDHRPGDRVLLVLPPGPHFVTSFVGCLFAGLVPVPAPLPFDNRSQEARTAGVLVSSGAAVVLTDEAQLERIHDWAVDVVPEIACLPAQIAARAEHPLEPVDLVPTDIAFLQYTSGSTSDPRGVVVTHASLMANLDLIRVSYGLAEGGRAGGWLPHYHDMGLIGTILLPLYLGGESVQMDPLTFLRRPELWLRMIERFDLDLSPAPNFGYELCVRRITAERVTELDLSRWRVAINGAEPVNPDTLARFAAHLAPAGFRPEALCPSYGMAETTLFVSASPPGQAPVTTWVDAERLEKHEFRPVEPVSGARLLVATGPVNGFDLRIVDPDSGAQLAEGEIGEIWLRGPSIGPGYWDRAEDTERVFQARTPEGEGPFLRTGDLGVSHQGGLYVTGRIKEVMILNGRNIYPQDVEREAASLDPACLDGIAAAFAVTVEGNERIVLVQEVRLRESEPEALQEVARRLSAGLSTRLGVPVGNIVLVAPGRVLRSTSGKVRRLGMKELFENSMLRVRFEELDVGVRRMFRGEAS